MSRDALIAGLALAALASLGCGGDGRSNPGSLVSEVRVAAASDLKFALEEVIAEFGRQHPQIVVKSTYGSSGNFFAQLSNRAPFDLYLSADIAYPRQLIDRGLAPRGSEFAYAVGQIVLWVPNDSPLDVGRGFEVLLDPAVRKIAIANPQHAPYGRAANEALVNLGVYDAVRERLVLGENISQAAQFVETGAAEAGIIALSLAESPALKNRGCYWQVPAAAYSPLIQGGVILEWAQDARAADQLRDFMTGRQGKSILKQFGFATPGD
jgi:molybdate transport system substrate-binding protein